MTDVPDAIAPTERRATPVGFGISPSGYRLPEATRLGPVRLQIAGLSRSITFYADVLGLQVVHRSASTATLAAQGSSRTLVELVERAGATPAGTPARLGLYHIAMLVPDRAALGRFVRHAAELGVRLGAGDHLVSEAFYLHDPDGLMIEVYADRPRAAWPLRGGELVMAVDPVDVEVVVRAAGDEPWTGMPAGTAIGHVHLHVGDLEAAAAFFAEALGFDRTVWTFPNALFLSAGGYHHHAGTNTWAGPHAQPARHDDARLLEWTIELPSTTDVAEIAESIATAGGGLERAANGDVLTADPWGTAIRIRPTSSAEDSL